MRDSELIQKVQVKQTDKVVQYDWVKTERVLRTEIYNQALHEGWSVQELRNALSDIRLIYIPYLKYHEHATHEQLSGKRTAPILSRQAWLNKYGAVVQRRRKARNHEDC